MFLADLKNVVTKIGFAMMVFRFNGFNIGRTIHAIVATVSCYIGSFLTPSGIGVNMSAHIDHCVAKPRVTFGVPFWFGNFRSNNACVTVFATVRSVICNFLAFFFGMIGFNACIVNCVAKLWGTLMVMIVLDLWYKSNRIHHRTIQTRITAMSSSVCSFQAFR